MLFIVAVHAFGTLEEEPMLVRRGTLLFMFISGFLFQYLSYSFNTSTYWRKKATNILIPYFIVSIPIVIIRLITNDYPEQITILFPDFNSSNSLIQAGEYFITGLQLIPFWFIPMICGYYLLAPVFIALDRDGRIYYLLPFFMALSLIVTRSYELHMYHLAFVHYLSIYLLGMFSSRHYKTLLRLTDKIWPVLALLTVAVVAIGMVFSKEQIHYQEQFLYIQKLVLCWAFVYSFWKFDKYIPKSFGILSDMSFGIFFLHYYLLYFVSTAMHRGQLKIESTLLNGVLLFLVDLLICMVALSLIKRITGKNSRYLVGY